MEKTRLTSNDANIEKYGGMEEIDPSIDRSQELTLNAPEIKELSLEELNEFMKTPTDQLKKKIEEEYGSIEQLCYHLRTHPDTGLNGKNLKELERRKEKYGSNVIPAKKKKMFLCFIWEAIQDTTLIILLVAALVSIALSFYSPPQSSDLVSDDPTGGEAGFIEGIGILVAVLLIVFVTAGINYSKDNQFRSLQKQLQQHRLCCVVRSSVLTNLRDSDLVVGDICHLGCGDIIPADGIIVYSNDLKVDESSHSGESREIQKGIEFNPILFAGTYAVEGSGKMVVTAVGLNSAKGTIFTLLGATDDEENEPTEKKSLLQKKLASLAMHIAYAGTAIALLTFVILIIRFCVDNFVIDEKPWSNVYFQNFVSFLIISITLLVVAVPEGLPLAVILSLAYSINKMVKDNNLVRHLDACEIMGNATTILCDKTGTLTTNRMTVVQSYIQDAVIKDPSVLMSLHDKTRLLLASSIAINTSYKSQLQIDGNQIGSKTECALLKFVSDLGYDYHQLRQITPERNLIKVYTFTSTKKWMGTVVPMTTGTFSMSTPGDGCRIYVKGAWEVVLERCSWILERGNEICKLTDERKNKMIREVVEPMSNGGLRTMTIAYKDFTLNPASEVEDTLKQDINWENENEICSRLVCIAIVGMEDPVRPEVPEAVHHCQKAGITVRMITGDYLNTARFVAIKCGILNPLNEHEIALDGTEFNKRIRKQPQEQIDAELFDELWPRLRVLARSSPLDKYTLVKGIMQSSISDDRQVVAVTGDGTNDGPALKKAHVGFAMGLSGTDVAKEASDIILLNDNFSSIVKAVVWGRHVYDSIAKFVQFQLTVNVVAVVLALIGACVVTDSPLKGIQMLWVNLLMDSLASLSLATEEPSDDVLMRKPYGSSQHLISNMMLINILSHSVYQLIILFTILFAGSDLLDVDDGRDLMFRGIPNNHYTFLFNSFVMMILFNEINARKLDGNQNVFGGLFKSPIFICIWIASFAMQVIIVEFGGNVFFTVKLTWSQWLWSIFLGLSDLLYGQIVTASVNAITHCKNLKQNQRKRRVGEKDSDDSSSIYETSLTDFKPLWPQKKP